MRITSIIFLLVLLISVCMPVGMANADKTDKYDSLVGVSVAIDDNTDITYTGKHWEYPNGSTEYEYIARIQQAPIYTENGNAIRCDWNTIEPAQPIYNTSIDGKNTSILVGYTPSVLTITDNIFGVTVEGTAITTTYQGQSMSWNPIVLVDSKEYVAKGSPKLIAVDPINSNYQNNTLEWDYGVCVRRVRVIEGLIQETYIFDKDPKGTVWIKDNSQKSAGFIWAISPYAYDSAGNNLPINEYKQVSAKDMASAIYPVTIDPTDSFVTSASDADVVATDITWATAWAATSAGTLYDTQISLIIGSYYTGSAWGIWRSGLYFDTSAIPDSANISACNLSLYGYQDYSVNDFNISVTNGQPTYPHDPMVLGDYNKANYTGLGNAGFATSGFSTAGYNNVSLNTTGISWISVTGYTKLFLRSSKDISGTAPTGTTHEAVTVYSYEKGAGYRPTLYITYTSSGVPTVTTNPATYVTKTTAQLNGYLDADGGEPCTVWFNYSVNGSGTYNVTANQTGKVTGDSFIASLTGLTANTLYNFSAVAWNSYGQVNGSWQQFNTTLTLQAPTNMVCSADSNAISLSWTKGGNTSQTYIRYKIGSYPTGTTDGNAVANQSGTDYYHTGLLSGTSYYYRLWGLDGTEFSTTNVTTMCSTTAGVINISPNPLPTSNTSAWWNDPNASALENNPLYPTVNLMADELGIPHNFWWLLIGIGSLVIGGLFIYVRTNKNILLSMIVVIILGVIMAQTGIFPLWTMFVFGFMGIGMAWKELR